MPRDALSKREQEVLAELRSGGRVASIASQLSISPTTVRNHLQRIFWKLGVHSQVELIEYVREHPETLDPAAADPATCAAAEAEARYWEANQRLGAELDAILEERWGPQAFREVLHRALPLTEHGREEWLARLAVWSREKDIDSELAEKRAEEMQTWRHQAEERIVRAQADGWLRSNLTPRAIIEQLFSLLVGVSLQLVVDVQATRKDVQVRIVDAYLDDLLSGPAKGEWRA